MWDPESDPWPSVDDDFDVDGFEVVGFDVMPSPAVLFIFLDVEAEGIEIETEKRINA